MNDNSLRQSFKKVKGNKGQQYLLDIRWDVRPERPEEPQPIRSIQVETFQGNELLKATWSSAVFEISNCKALKEFVISKPSISLVFLRDWTDSTDIFIDFVCRIKDTSQFLFFEADLNTFNKDEKDPKFQPKIYNINCYKIVDEYAHPDYLLPYANAALKRINGDTFKDFNIVNVNLARNIFVAELINPETFALLVTIFDNNKKSFKALLTYTVEEDTGMIAPGYYTSLEPGGDKTEYLKRESEEIKVIVKAENEIKEIDFFELANEFSYEIMQPTKELKNSSFMKKLISNIEKEKFVDSYGYSLNDLLSGFSFKKNSEVELSLIVNFVYVKSNNFFSITEFNFICKRVGKKELNNYEFALKRHNTNIFESLKDVKKVLTKYDANKLQEAVNESSKINDSSFSSFEEFKIINTQETYYLNNDSLIFPEFYCVKLSYQGKNKIEKNSLIFYSLDDFEKSIILLCHYNLDKNCNLFLNIDNIIDKLTSEIEESSYILNIDFSKKLKRIAVQFLFKIT